MRELFTINGRSVELALEPGYTLLRTLRENGYTEVKNGCEEGECGACMVLVDDKAVPSCRILAMSVRDRHVKTVKALGTLREASILQKIFVEEGAVQCGFCTAGMLLSSWALLHENLDPTEEEIISALDGNLCRCTGYKKIVKAVKRAARKIREETGHV